MNEALKLFTNEVLWLPLLTSFAAQVLKVIIYSVRFRKLDLTWFTTTGGMPSSHSAGVSALSTLVGFKSGFDSVLFAAIAFFSLIIMYDAAGIRRAAGKQASILNIMIEKAFRREPVSDEKLKELLGHTPMEVLAGASLGVAIALLMI